jgi:hypothetical protein
MTKGERMEVLEATRAGGGRRAGQTPDRAADSAVHHIFEIRGDSWWEVRAAV